MSKFLGQHFLVNKGVLARVAAALDLQTGEQVIEIGPGTGALTQELIKQPIQVIAVEKDTQLARILESRILNQESRAGRFEVIEGDILKLLPSIIDTLPSKNYKIVGNIPYYITGYLLRVIGELAHKPKLAVFMIQKEVAERICAQPPAMNLLAASVQIWCQPEVIAFVPARDFQPPPEVDSAIVKFTIQEKWDNDNAAQYYRFIKILFKQPRKTILNNLADGFLLTKEEVQKRLAGFGLSAKERPQDIPLEMLIRLRELF